MSGISKKLMSAAGSAGGGFTAIEDVFSTYLYTGNGSTQTITNGIDLAGEGGLVWIKGRSSDESHNIYDTERGAGEFLNSATNEGSTSVANGLTSFNSDGFSVGSNFLTSRSGVTYASWTFRKAPRFFDVVTYTGNGVAGRQIPHNLGTTVGTIIVKQTDGVRDWPVYHRGVDASNPSNYKLVLNKTDARADENRIWNDTEPTDTVFTVGDDGETNGDGNTYVAYLFAHDPLGPSGDGSDGLIACGSTGGGKVTLGWEPQWILHKSSNFSSDWSILDVQRGMPWGQQAQELEPHTSDAEALSRDDVNAQNYSPKIHPDGFELGTIAGSHIYIAIRRGPMRAPESGTEVFAMDNADGTFPAFDSNFPVDLGLQKFRDLGVGTSWGDRLRGPQTLGSSNTSAEGGANEFVFDSNVGWRTATASSTLHSWMFRRAPNFFDVVAYTGTGSARTVPHNLGVAPEMIIFKARNTSDDNWFVYAAPLGPTKGLYLNATNAAITSPGVVNDTAPTESVFSTSAAAFTNISATNYIAYLFATLAGVSKVGSYTGNGSSQTIDCGFTTGARFVLIKRTDAAGDWYVWDTARGIVAANDPHLSLNTTAAEVTTDDSIDPASSGFIVNQVAATNINVSAASYIFYAVS